MVKRPHLIALMVVYVTSFFVPTVEVGPRDATDSWYGWKAALGAGLLLIQSPLGRNNPDAEPWATLIGLSVLVNAWYIWTWVQLVVRPGVRSALTGLTIIVIGAAALVWVPFGYFAWKGEASRLLAGYYLWAGAITAFAITAWGMAYARRNSADEC
jgi:hypothetical protein